MATKTKDIRATIKAHLGDIISFSVPDSVAQGGHVSLHVADLPDETLVELVRYGAGRWLNDKLGGTKMTADEKLEKYNKLHAALHSGDFSSSKRGGGKRVDMLEQCKREVYADTLASRFDYNVTEAKKLVKSDTDRTIALKRAIAHKLKLDLEENMVFEKLSQVQTKLDDHATTIAAQRETPEIDI